MINSHMELLISFQTVASNTSTKKTRELYDKEAMHSRRLGNVGVATK